LDYNARERALIFLRLPPAIHGEYGSRALSIDRSGTLLAEAQCVLGQT
jgi:hypothetical protein